MKSKIQSIYVYHGRRAGEAVTKLMEFHELQHIVESNSRAIQAILDLQAEARELREAKLRLEGVAEGIANLLSSLD